MAVKLRLLWSSAPDAAHLKISHDIQHTFMNDGKLTEIQFPVPAPAGTTNPTGLVLNTDPLVFTFIDEASANEFVAAIAELNPKSTIITTE